MPYTSGGRAEDHSTYSNCNAAAAQCSGLSGGRSNAAIEWRLGVFSTGDGQNQFL